LLRPALRLPKRLPVIISANTCRLGTLTYADGREYVGEYKDGNRDGNGTATSANGSKYMGEFRKNYPNRQGTATHPSGDQYVGEFKDEK